MKKKITIILTILSLVLVLCASFASADVLLNPAQFPYSIFSTPDLYYLGSNTGSESGVPCALQATSDNRIRAWFQANGFAEASLRPSSIPFCVAVYPDDPSETVNTSTYLSSSQKNYIGVQITEGICELFFYQYALQDIKPAQLGEWSDHLPGLTTGTANPVVGISLIKLQDSAIAGYNGYDYETIAGALSAAGFMLDRKGFWVNQCYGQPFLFYPE